DRGMSVAMPGLGLGGPPLLSMGTPEQKERFLAPFRDRERPHWAAFGMTEPGAGSDVAAIQTAARREGDGWVLNGAKTFISNSMRADWIVVWATVDRAAGRAGHRAFVVERGTPGLEDMRYEHKMGLIAYESSSFTLHDCCVPAANLLGGERYYAERAGFKGAMRSFNATSPASSRAPIMRSTGPSRATSACARSSRAWRGRSRRAVSSAGAPRTWPTWSSRTRSRPRWRRRSRPAWRRRRRASRSRSWATRASPATPTSRSSTAT